MSAIRATGMSSQLDAGSTQSWEKHAMYGEDGPQGARIRARTVLPPLRVDSRIPHRMWNADCKNWRRRL